MSSSAELHLCYKVGNASVSMFPYPHFYLENVFPQAFYDQLRSHLPNPEAMLPIAEVRKVRGYKERFVMEFGGEQMAALPEEKRKFWSDLEEWLVGGRFGQLLFSKFAPYIEERFKGTPRQFYDEALLVQDVTNYALGPHTDAPRKVITMLFYLPGDDAQSHLGTSIYLPKDPNFTCEGKAHYQHADFEQLYAMPFRPNSLFCFLKTYNSFHGVEPVGDPDTRRWLLLYDIYAKDVAPASQPAPAPATGVKFSF